MVKFVIYIFSYGLSAYCRGFPLPTFISHRYIAQPHHTLCPALLRARLIPPLHSLLILLLLSLLLSPLSPPETTRDILHGERLGRKRETRSITHLTQKVNLLLFNFTSMLCVCLHSLQYNYRMTFATTFAKIPDTCVGC